MVGNEVTKKKKNFLLRENIFIKKHILRAKYQGLESPVPRSEIDFDPGIHDYKLNNFFRNFNY